MTIHTLVHSSDSFSCHCNSIIPSLSNCHLRAILTSSLPLLRLYKSQCIFQWLSLSSYMYSNVSRSTKINSSMYIHTSAFVSFETHPIIQQNFLKIILQPVGWKLRIPPQVLNTAQWGNHAGFLML